MELGQLGSYRQPVTVFVFEGLVGVLDKPRAEKTALKMHRWPTALDCWHLDSHVLDYMMLLQSRFGVPVQVITSRPYEFALKLYDRLWQSDCPVDEVRSGDYEHFSPHFAIDPDVNSVYDPDPAHRFGYGFKARDFTAEKH